MGRPEGKNGRASPGFFCYLTAPMPNPWSIPRAVEITKRVFPFGASIGGRLLVAGK
jgi:hypothetical protein